MADRKFLKSGDFSYCGNLLCLVKVTISSLYVKPQKESEIHKNL